MQGPSLVRGFAPAGIGPRDISNPFDIQSAALGGTTYYGGSAEVDFPDLRPAERNRAERRGFRRRRQSDRIFGSDQLLEFPRLYLLPDTGVARRSVPHHAVELRQRMGPEPDPHLGGREFDLGLADGTDPLRLRARRLRRASTTRRSSSTSPAARRSKVDQPTSPSSGRARAGAPVVASDGTPQLARIRFFPPSSAPSLAEVASWCGATLAASADAGRVIRDVAALDQAGQGDLTFLDNPRYLDALKRTRAAAALVSPRYAGAAPSDLRRAHRPASPIARWPW